jgi:hypothetical protein
MAKTLSASEDLVCSTVSASGLINSSTASVRSEIKIGSSLLGSHESGISISANLEVDGKLSVAQLALLGSNLSVGDQAFCGSQLSGSGSFFISEGISVRMNSALDSIIVSEEGCFNKTVYGESCILRGELSISGSLFAGSSLSILRDSIVLSVPSLSVSEQSASNLGNLSVSGSAIFASNLSIGSFGVIHCGLSVESVSADRVEINQLLELERNAIIRGNLSVGNLLQSSACLLIQTLSCEGSSVSGGSISVQDQVVASYISTHGSVNIGSILSVSQSSFIEGDISAKGALHLGDFTLYADNTRLISAAPSGVGCFHGTWSFEVATTTSDRRLKHDITPLAKSLVNRRDQSNHTTSEWILDRLRPVSFKLNEGDGGVRFGFIAQVRGLLSILLHS